MAWTIARWKMIGQGVAALLLLGLLTETLAAYPDYIPFFNAPTRARADGINLLSDSNLDWGQDLKQLGVWQRTHRDKPLYLSYFGVVDPFYYGINATHMPGGWLFDQNKQLPPSGQSCYVAVSATNLQGIYHMPDIKEIYRQLDIVKPTEILGGTIYIYELPAPESMLRSSRR